MSDMVYLYFKITPICKTTNICLSINFSRKLLFKINGIFSIGKYSLEIGGGL